MPSSQEGKYDEERDPLDILGEEFEEEDRALRAAHDTNSDDHSMPEPEMEGLLNEQDLESGPPEYSAGHLIQQKKHRGNPCRRPGVTYCCDCFQRFVACWCAGEERLILCIRSIFAACCGCSHDNLTYWASVFVVSWRECIVIGLYIAWYEIMRGVENVGGTNTPYLNADDIIGFEKTMNMYNEEAWQKSILGTDWTYVFVYFYLYENWIITPAMILLLLWFNSTYSAFMRNWVFIASTLSLITWAVYPVAPPRLVPGSGLVDLIAVVEDTDSGSANSTFSNSYCAFPSMHVGWSTICGLYGMFILYNSKRPWWFKGLIAIPCLGYPMLLIATVVVTGNHWFVDALGGIAYVLSSALLCYYLCPDWGLVDWDDYVERCNKRLEPSLLDDFSDDEMYDNERELQEAQAGGLTGGFGGYSYAFRDPLVFSKYKQDDDRSETRTYYDVNYGG